jgi:hypothetical protein
MSKRFLIECSDLDDFELEDLKRFLTADSRVKDVVWGTAVVVGTGVTKTVDA